MKDLSVIIPFVNEFPQVAFTVQSIFAELQDSGLNFEIVCVDNWCDEVAQQVGSQDPNAPRQQDAGSQWMNEIQRKREDYLRVYQYTHKLSHWQAKNLGVRQSTGKILWFCDAHCIVSPGSLVAAVRYYQEHNPRGTLHLPLSYMLERPGGELIYKLVYKPDTGEVHYSFTPYRKHNTKEVAEVPCMSTCGMLMSREIYDTLGGWPEELGIYGGGENFINYTLAVMGYKKFIFPSRPLWHYAAKRGYYWNYNDYHRNRCIATLMFGGPQWAHRYIMNIKGRDPVKRMIYDDVIKKCDTDWQRISRLHVTTIDKWAENYVDNP